MTTHPNAWFVALAAEHRADLAAQDAFYQQNPMNDDAGSDE